MQKKMKRQIFRNEANSLNFFFCQMAAIVEKPLRIKLTRPPKGPERIGPCEPGCSYEFDPTSAMFAAWAEFKSMHDDPTVQNYLVYSTLGGPHTPTHQPMYTFVLKSCKRVKLSLMSLKKLALYTGHSPTRPTRS
jgi:hypothetical protein